MAGTSAIISAIAAVGGAVAQNKAVRAQNKAQKRSASLERAAAQLEANRRARRAVAERRIKQAQLIQSGVTEGLRSSSALSGAVGSLTTQTASNIGAANTQLAAQMGQSIALQRGASKAAKFGTIANTFRAIGQASSSVGSSPQASQAFSNIFSRNS